MHLFLCAGSFVEMSIWPCQVSWCRRYNWGDIFTQRLAGQKGNPAIKWGTENYFFFAPLSEEQHQSKFALLLVELLQHKQQSDFKGQAFGKTLQNETVDMKTSHNRSRWKVKMSEIGCVTLRLLCSY